ncbi:MAG: hypothetical protein QME60_08870 [Verrucomicrobiota bacterium]|nr:hypothetical protein [Verrucomicrobiota bacterium]
MKKFTTGLFSILLAIPVLAAPSTHQGVYEARIEPTADLAGVEDNMGISVRGAFGYYLSQNVQLGGSILFAKKEFESYWGKGNVWGLGLYGEFNADWGLALYPYVGVGAMLLDDSNDNRDPVLQITVSPGVKVFLTDYISLSIQANWNAAKEEIYEFERDLTVPLDGEGKTSALTGAVAIRFLFY